MTDTTTMLANMILIALENQERWVSEPRFETLSIIEDVRTSNKIISKRYNSAKINAMEKNLGMIKSIVKMYGAQSEE